MLYAYSLLIIMNVRNNIRKVNLKVKRYSFDCKVLLCSSWSALLLDVETIGIHQLICLQLMNPWKGPALCEQFNLVVVVYWCGECFVGTN